jgi:hypothetical protein
VVLTGTSIVWRFCGPNPAPVFLAIQDGSTPFAAVTPAGDGSYTTTFASTRGAVAIVQPGLPEPPETAPPGLRAPARTIGRVVALQAGYTTQVRYASIAELQALAAAQCPPSVATKTVHGSVANVPAGNLYTAALGGALALGIPGASPNFTLDRVMDGLRDLIAGRATPLGDGAVPDALILRRDHNPLRGSTLALLDFASAEAFAPASAQLDVSPANAEVFLGFRTANGTVGLFGFLGDPAATRTWFGIPGNRLRTGDLHTLSASISMSGPFRLRELELYSSGVGTRSITLADEPAMPVVEVHAITPVIRLRAAGDFGSTGTAFAGIAQATFAQADRAWIVSQTRAWTGTSSIYDLRTAVLTGLAGWNESVYGVKGGDQVSWYVMMAGKGAEFVPADGAVLQRYTAGGQLVP